MLRLFFSLFVFLILLTACHIQPKVEYTYVPPQSKMDKKCVALCLKAKRYCQEICELKNPDCFAKTKMDAVKQNNVCENACNCIPAFNTCYSACGGQVITRYQR
jgi:hypothetical protein